MANPELVGKAISLCRLAKHATVDIIHSIPDLMKVKNNDRERMEEAVTLTQINMCLSKIEFLMGITDKDPHPNK